MMIETHIGINRQCLSKSIRQGIAADLAAGLRVLVPGLPPNGTHFGNRFQKVSFWHSICAGREENVYSLP